MAVEWDDLIPSKVFTRIKTNFPQSLKTKYKMTDKNFSTVGSSVAHQAILPLSSVSSRGCGFLNLTVGTTGH